METMVWQDGEGEMGLGGNVVSHSRTHDDPARVRPELQKRQREVVRMIAEAAPFTL